MKAFANSMSIPPNMFEKYACSDKTKPRKLGALVGRGRIDNSTALDYAVV